MGRYFIELSYSGKGFCGWQRQPSVLSVQESIEKALGIVLRQECSVVGAGRTDSGVHALYYVAHFDVDKEGLEKDERLLRQLNGLVPSGIGIHAIHAVDGEAHARFDAVERRYIYRISRIKNPFEEDRAYFYPHKLDVEEMNKAAALLVSLKDFTSFSKLHTDVKNNLCDVRFAQWLEVKDRDMLYFEIGANRFLRNMVRSIVGTLLDVGRGKIGAEEVLRIASCKDRCAAGTSVPAHGLYLADILYPEEVFTPRYSRRNMSVAPSPYSL